MTFIAHLLPRFHKTTVKYIIPNPYFFSLIMQ